MQINALDKKYAAQISNQIEQKTKPVGALGQLETVAAQLALIASNRQNKFADKIHISQATALVFAGDHGINEAGVSIAPSAVTQQMVLNFIAGGAAINCFCRAHDIHLKVIDCGMIEPIDSTIANASDSFYEQRLGSGTENFANKSAMTIAQVNQGLEFGAAIAEQQINNGCNLLILGEMGIANTSSSSAIIAALTNTAVELCVGLGTGISEQQLLLKKQLITHALKRNDSSDAMTVMQEFGGFEIVQMVGAILASAKAGITVLIDGFIVSTAALLAKQLQPNVSDYLIFAHQSEEFAHQLVLKQFAAKPLLSLGLRLGEGTGAALALPLLKAASHFYNDMASFAQANVTV